MTSCHNISALRKFGMGSGREGERALFFCCAVGAGHAPPAILRQRESNGETAQASNARPYNVACESNDRYGSVS